MQAMSEWMLVTAAVIEEEGKVLIARRKTGDRFGGCWEFPGGKIEPGELPEEALKREIREELDIEVRVGDLLCSFPFRIRDINMELMAFRTTRMAGAIACREHDEIRWVDPADLPSFEMTEPDRRVVSALYPVRGGSK
jgi:8-oxo-dGTP diphosphatase